MIIALSLRVHGWFTSNTPEWVLSDSSYLSDLWQMLRKSCLNSLRELCSLCALGQLQCISVHQSQASFVKALLNASNHTECAKELMWEHAVYSLHCKSVFNLRKSIGSYTLRRNFCLVIYLHAHRLAAFMHFMLKYFILCQNTNIWNFPWPCASSLCLLGNEGHLMVIVIPSYMCTGYNNDA